MLVFQQWHGLSDPELEKQVTDRISFRKFPGFPAVIPDFTTVWYFRERLAKTGKDRTEQYGRNFSDNSILWV